MLAESHEEGLIEEIAHDLLTGALDFGERPVATVMVPREQIRGRAASATVAEAEQVVVASGHSVSRSPGRDLDDIVGFVHAKDLLTCRPTPRADRCRCALIRRVLVVPSRPAARRGARAMRRSRTHVARAWSTTTGARSASPRSRTCSRTWSATSSTSPIRGATPASRPRDGEPVDDASSADLLSDGARRARAIERTSRGCPAARRGRPGRSTLDGRSR